MIPLVKDTIDKSDIDSLISWLQTYPRLTKGEITEEYESKWAEFLGCQYAVFVNSGSSANMVMLYALMESGCLKQGDSVIVPAVSWATDLAPVVQLGLNPVLCDCNMNDLSVDLEDLEDKIKKHKAKCLILVSVLGLVPNMTSVLDVCDRNEVLLLEDSCESLGSKFKGQNLGTFGIMSSFSTYFGHHISTIEGGMVCTNNRDMYNMVKCLRSHGWDRDLDEDKRVELRSGHDISDFESLYKFYHYGFNFRPTDLQAFIGMRQLEKADYVVKQRNKNYLLYCDTLGPPENLYWAPQAQDENIYISNFAFPVIHPNRDEMVSDLQDNNIAVRPLICGSLELQPFWKSSDDDVQQKNAKTINDLGFYVPNNHQMSSKDISKVCDVIRKRL